MPLPPQHTLPVTMGFKPSGLCSLSFSWELPEVPLNNSSLKNYSETQARLKGSENCAFTVERKYFLFQVPLEEM